MTASEFSQRILASVATPKWSGGAIGEPNHNTPGASKLWIVLDGITVLGAALIAILWEVRADPVSGVKALIRGTLIHGWSMGVFLVLLYSFILSLVLTSRRLHLYHPTRMTGFLQEQRLTVQACSTPTLLLIGTPYLVHASDIPRGILLLTSGLVVISLSLRRMLYRAMLYRRFARGKGTRSVFIVGTGPQAHAIRDHMDSFPHLGYSFKGFIELSGSTSQFAAPSADVVGCLETLFRHARQQFVDEILVTAPCERGVVLDVLENARLLGIDLRIVPNIYYGMAKNRPIEYIGQFAIIPLRSGHVPATSVMV
jgi:FlaA1/EpsC-like NDP-sugar epimerase